MVGFHRLLAASIALVVSGCATVVPQAKLEDTTKKFAAVVSDSTTIVTTETSAKVAVRRDEAIMYYLQHPRDETNLTPDGKPRSFANFVCAGRGSLNQQIAALEYLKAYSDNLSAIVKPGGDTLAEQWKKAKTLSIKPMPLATPKPSEKPKTAFDSCVVEVVPALDFQGVSVTDFSNENPLAVIEGVQALVVTLGTIAKDGIKTWNELAARRRFSELVTEQHQDFQARLAIYLDPDKLDNAWQRRKSRALWRPYRAFSRMIDLDVASKRDEIISAAAEVNKQLAEYDALSRTKPPSQVVEALGKAEQGLYDVAQNKDASPTDILNLLDILAKDVDQIKKDYEAAEKAADALAGL